ncbi:MAG: hypothetical protein KatS3mg090_0177 [Patescibacteria group bacterium]|nr:MAG: hypothetical protein KatS3mg090_0177 [Patescibacteria group bacterium]
MSPRKEIIDWKTIFFSALSAVFLITTALFLENKILIFGLFSIYILIYILYGVYYHIANKDLTLKKTIEYVLIGFILFYMIKLLLIN